MCAGTSRIRDNLTIGTYGCGLNLLQHTWSRHRFIFEIDPNLQDIDRFTFPPAVGPEVRLQPTRVASTIFETHPVGIFVADHSNITALAPLFGVDGSCVPEWVRWLATCTPIVRPRIVIQVWPSWTLWRAHGPASKLARKALERLGYSSRYRVLHSAHHSSPVRQDRLVVIMFLQSSSTTLRSDSTWDWSNDSDSQSALTARPMSNCLRPYPGAGSINSSLPCDFFVGITSPVPHSTRDPMPDKAGRWIETPKGFSKLCADELAKGLGVPTRRLRHPRRVPPRLVDHLVGVHLWEGISAGLDTLLPLVFPELSAPSPSSSSSSSVPRSLGPSPSPLHPPSPPSCPPAPLTVETAIPVAPGADAHEESPTAEWAWSPPDLRRNRPWYRSRLASLKRALKSYPEATHSEMLLAGKADLDHHRSNYTPTGPQHLQILWWEFPAEHWEELRLGCSMNFMKEPEHILRPNSDMTPIQLATASEFFDELIDLGALEECPPDDPMLATCPLFVLPKAGQPGQWRVIADAKAGGQNECVGQDPVYLPGVNQILTRLYSGGWSAVIDASKFFYQFPTVMSERKYLGALHPTTGRHYRYAGLPMGAGNSPGIAGRLGNAFIRRLTERHPDLFDGVPLDNSWRSQLADDSYDPKLGHGKNLISTKDGLAAALVFGFVDDFFLHSPTYEKLVAALDKFMDFALEVGLLCNPAKVIPPSQEVKYCGFIFDTRGVPMLRIPEAKLSRSLAMIEYFLTFKNGDVPRLSLVVITGVLESLVDATPARTGHTYLRRLYDTIWATEPPAGTSGKDVYYLMVQLDDHGWADLAWWRSALRSRISRPARPTKTATLIATFGDGSGTGTGGTREALGSDPTPLEMWMGTWSNSVHSFSSNWKELKTLELTLSRELARGDGIARHTTLFYFTDNMVTYYTVSGGSARSPTLQKLLYRIKDLELQLGCFLEVVHIPGTAIIAQGSDDLSRGLWLSQHRSYAPAPQLIPTLFQAVMFREGWEDRLRTMLPFLRHSPCCSAVHWDSPWRATDIFDRLTIWHPPPEMAAHALHQLLSTWVERPRTTSAVILIPRVFQRQWRRASSYLHQIRSNGTFYCLESPEPSAPQDFNEPDDPQGPQGPQDPQGHSCADCFDLSDPTGPIHHPLPVVVLYLPPHVPSLADPRMEQPPSTVPWKRRRWYQRQKELLYRL